MNKVSSPDYTCIVMTMQIRRCKHNAMRKCGNRNAVVQRKAVRLRARTTLYHIVIAHHTSYMVQGGKNQMPLLSHYTCPLHPAHSVHLISHFQCERSIQLAQIISTLPPFVTLSVFLLIARSVLS